MTKALPDPLNDLSTLGLVLSDGAFVKAQDLFESRYFTACRQTQEPLAQSLAFLELGEGLFGQARRDTAKLRKRVRSGAGAAPIANSELDFDLETVEEIFLRLRDIAERASKAIRQGKLELALQLVTGGWMDFAFSCHLVPVGLKDQIRHQNARRARQVPALLRHEAVARRMVEVRKTRPARIKGDEWCLRKVYNETKTDTPAAREIFANPGRKPKWESFKRWWSRRPDKKKKGHT